MKYIMGIYSVVLYNVAMRSHQKLLNSWYYFLIYFTNLKKQNTYCAFEYIKHECKCQAH